MNKIKETITFEGEWWLPNNSKEKLYGKLRYHYQEGLFLELDDCFESFLNQDPLLCHVPIILGELENQKKKITLFACHLQSYSPNGDQKNHSRIFCQMAFSGYHFNSSEEIKYKKIYAQFTHLDEWLGITGFKVVHSYDEKLDARKISVEYTDPKSITARLDDNFSIAFDFHYKNNTGYYPTDEATIVQIVRVCIEADTESTLSDFFKIIFQLERFFSLGMMRQIYAFNLQGIAPQIFDEDEFDYPRDIFVIINKNFELGKRLYPQEMLFSYNDVKGRIEILLQNWFKKREALEPIFDLYFSASHNQTIPDYLRFLCYVQALESFHRRIIEKYTFKHLNTRLEEIFKKNFEFQFYFDINVNQFIQDAVNTRHFHTHGDESLKNKILSGSDLEHASRKLRAMLQLIFLLELGFEKTEMNIFAGKIYRRQLGIVYTSFNF